MTTRFINRRNLAARQTPFKKNGRAIKQQNPPPSRHWRGVASAIPLRRAKTVDAAGPRS
jgi:hypothetical protein